MPAGGHAAIFLAGADFLVANTGEAPPPLIVRLDSAINLSGGFG